MLKHYSIFLFIHWYFQPSRLKLFKWKADWVSADCRDMPHSSVTNSSPLVWHRNFKYPGNWEIGPVFFFLVQFYMILSSLGKKIFATFFFLTKRLKLTYLGQAAFRTERTAALRADPLNDRLGEKEVNKERCPSISSFWYSAESVWTSAFL